MRARALRDSCLAIAVVACGCAVEPSRTFYDDLEGGGDGHVIVGSSGGEAGGSDDVTTPPSEAGDDAPIEASTETGVSEASADQTAPPLEAGVDARADAPAEAAPPEAGPPEAGPDAPVEAGCGPTNTVSNCGACGAACGGLHAQAGGTACVSGSCQYTCATGYANCSQTGSNTTGCECHTPACCGSGCQTTHQTGLPTGLNYYDCNPLATASMSQQTLLDLALEACTAFTGSVAQCASDLTCSRTTIGPYVCNGMGIAANCTTCWSYGGTDILKTESCTCPLSGQQPTIIGTWN